MCGLTLPERGSSATLEECGKPPPTESDTPSRSHTAPLPLPSLDIRAPRGAISGPLLTCGHIRVRLAVSKGRETTRRRINNAKRQFMLKDH
jgi:hypothetical protein